jgi:penicillin-binding protein 2
MKLFQPDTRKRRMLGAVFAISFALSILVTAFFHTQVVTGKAYAMRSEENRLRPIVIPAPRGTILDRNGEVVATSITGYSVSILPGDSATIHSTLQDLAPFLGLSANDVAVLFQRRNARPNDLLEVTQGATFSQAAAIEERRAAFPNLLVVERPRRYYPAGPAIGHMIGYVGEISERELQLPKYKDAGYRQGQLIGKSGIEAQYELMLGGKDGARFVEVDAMGRVVDPRSTVGAVSPTPGKTLHLTLDLELQKYIHSIFPDTMMGAVVALVPSTGEVLALYSHPNYDPNDFVGRIPGNLWRELNTDPMKPLLDRTVNALYPPASTWKTATALIGIQRGMVTATSHMPIPCTGGMLYAGRYARCWNRAGHGSLDLAHAIEKSCNVYFYQLGIRIGLAELTRSGTRLGFSRKTGIDLPNEKSGIFPTGIDWLKRRFGYVAPSDVMSLAIGQGPNQQSVLRQSYFYSAIAGNGTAPRPHLVADDSLRVDDDKHPALDLNLSRTGLSALWQGLSLVTEQDGTAVQSSLARYKLYGKTGTAQNPQGPDHGWFVGFAGPPNGNPEVVVGVIVEHGLHGDAAAPLAAKVANFYLDRKHGHPFDPAPTWGERMRAGKVNGFDPGGRKLLPPATAPEGARGDSAKKAR